MRVVFSALAFLLFAVQLSISAHASDLEHDILNETLDCSICKYSLSKDDPILDSPPSIDRSYSEIPTSYISLQRTTSYYQLPDYHQSRAPPLL